jgi:DNA-binding CsgD family transcriptional regulator
MLDGYIEDLTSGLVMDLQGSTSLSLSELRIASMIKHGMATEEIARLLYVSPDTVKTHRRNIRRKLRIKGAKKNLGAYLRSITQEAAEAEQNGAA